MQSTYCDNSTLSYVKVVIETAISVQNLSIKIENRRVVYSHYFVFSLLLDNLLYHWVCYGFSFRISIWKLCRCISLSVAHIMHLFFKAGISGFCLEFLKR